MIINKNFKCFIKGLFVNYNKKEDEVNNKELKRIAYGKDFGNF